MLTLAMSCSQADAEDVVTERAFFEDKRGDMSFEQVAQAGFSVAPRVINLGFTRSVVWVRLSVARSNDARQLALSILPATLDDVTLFYPGTEGRRLPHWATLVDVAPDRTDLYLRIRTKGAMLIAPSVLTDAQLHANEISRSIVLGAFLGCFFLVTAGLLVMSFQKGQALHAYCMLHLTVLAALFLNAFGYLTDYFEPPLWFSIAALGNYLIVLNGFLTVLILGAILQPLGLPGWGQRFFNWFPVLYAPLLLLFFVFDRQTILFASTGSAALASAAGILLTLAVFYRHGRGAWLIAMLIILALLNSLRLYLTMLGILAPVDWTINLLVFRSASLTITFVAILWLIHYKQQEALRESAMKAAESRQHAEFEKKAREVKDRFMAILLHEFKTPLAIIQIALSSLGRRIEFGKEDQVRVSNIHRAVDDLNAIIDRCVQADQMELGAMPMDKRSFALSALLDDLLQTLDASRITLTAPDECIVFSDFHYLKMILLNLLGNALKYSPPHSMVELRIDRLASQDGGGVNFSISNSPGKAGVPDPARLFTRYYRSEGARRHVGAGLGLWLAQTMATQLGSQINFFAEQSRVCFNFRMEHP